MPYSLKARVVLPVDRPPIEHGVVTIDGVYIAHVGQEVLNQDAFDLGNVALLPGLVNAHTHLEFSSLRRPLGTPGMAIADWIRLVIAERGKSAIDSRQSIVAGLNESLAYGVTTVGDIALGASAPVNVPAPDRTSFLEVIGFSRARADSAFAALGERIESSQVGQYCRLGVSPHSPYTVSPDLFVALVNLACEKNLPVAMHLAESREEIEFLALGTGAFQQLLDERSMWDADAVPRGTTPMNYLKRLAEASRSLVIHGNYLTNEELRFIGERSDRMSLVYCPRTHAYFGHRPYPLRAALDAGTRVAIGTDSRASNPDFNLLSEMRHIASNRRDVRAYEILRMGTLSGAEALGRADEIGSITIGKLANLVAIPLPEISYTHDTDWTSLVFANHQRPNGVWLRGDRIG